MKEQRREALRTLGKMLADNMLARRHPVEVIVGSTVDSLTRSVYKSADSGEDRGDFAKGREQMAMHAIALLVGAKNWKQIERILFGDDNGD